MNPADEPRSPGPATTLAETLDTGEEAYDRARFGAALEAGRAAAAAGVPAGLWARAARLRCLAAFRVGEIAEAADAALVFVEATQATADTAAVTDAQRLDVMCVSVVAAGESLRYSQSLAHLRLALQAAQRLGSLAAWVRARGTAAAAFTLLGDPWAAQRLAAELAGIFQAVSDEPRLEATARTNHCGSCLVLARMAREVGDEATCAEALEHAEASLARLREIVAVTRDARGMAFADVNEAELALLQGGGARALKLLGDALPVVEAAGLRGHARWLRLTEAEALVAVGDCEQAVQRLEPQRLELGEGQEFAMRVRLHELLHRAHLGVQNCAAARQHLEQAQALERRQRYAQLHAQSAHLRERLELEHMYRYRGRGGFAGG